MAGMTAPQSPETLRTLAEKATPGPWRRLESRAILNEHVIDELQQERNELLGVVSAARAEIEGLRAVRDAAVDVDSLWEAEDGELIRWQVEAGEALNDLRAALDRSQP
jgi:hypothetical protein